MILGETASRFEPGQAEVREVLFLPRGSPGTGSLPAVVCWSLGRGSGSGRLLHFESLPQDGPDMWVPWKWAAHLRPPHPQPPWSPRHFHHPFLLRLRDTTEGPSLPWPLAISSFPSPPPAPVTVTSAPHSPPCSLDLATQLPPERERGWRTKAQRSGPGASCHLHGQ